MMTPQELDLILTKVAYKQHSTVQQVRNEIMIAMKEAQQSSDPNVQAMWAGIPRQGDVPTLEEFMAFLICNLTES